MKYSIHIVLITLALTLTSAQQTPNSQRVRNAIQAIEATNNKNNTPQIKILKTCQLSEFDDYSKQKLKGLIQTDHPQRDQLILLGGFIGLDASLFKQIGATTKKESVKQAAKLARVRLGDKALLANMMKNIKKLPVNDEFVYIVAPMLLYVRQQEATNYVLEVLQRKGSTCSVPNPERSGTINCGYRLMEQLPPVINNFPYTLKTSGDLDTPDYKIALSNIRKWIAENKSNYSMNKTVY